MPTDFNQVLAADRVVVGQTCKMSKALAALDPKVRAGVNAALADPSIPSAKIARGVSKLVHPMSVSGNNVIRHRSHECKCPHD